MEFDNMLRGLSVSASGLVAERLRMGLIATNIAHASDTDRGDGTPYRRQEPVFQTVMEGAMAGGVRVTDVINDDRTPMVRVERRGHPMADENGMLTLPNVNPAVEMVDLVTAARSYEANLHAMRTQMQMAEQALELGR